MIIDSIRQVLSIEDSILEYANQTKERFNNFMSTTTTIDLFHNMKFNQGGIDPIKGTPLNFIEQLNQTFSDLVVVDALKELLIKYPDKHFEVNFGSKAGFDIQSCDKSVVAECFAVTSVSSNNKLRKDATKLLTLAKNTEKYIYFYSENDGEEKLEKFYKEFPEIIFIRIKKIDRRV